MKWVDAMLIAGVAVLAVFWEASFDGVRLLAGTQVHLLPPLMVYAALRRGFGAVVLLALAGGLLKDSLSANPFGASVLPLLAAGIAICWRREVIFQSQVFAQAVLGAAVGVAVPCMKILLLLTMRESPLLGWGTIWQLVVDGAAGAFLAPAFFCLFEWIEDTFMYQPSGPGSFRPDREIRRGR